MANRPCRYDSAKRKAVLKKTCPGGALRQSYVGPDDVATQALIQRHADPAAKLAKQQMVRITRAAIELGCADIPPKHARVIERLADRGLFSAGAILVGTQAFLAYQKILGVLKMMTALYPACDFQGRLELAVAQT